jgi:chaperone modulatory protein CbpM
MENEHYISAQEFCGYHEVEYTFIRSLNEAGLLQITTVNQITVIPQSELPRLERMIRLHQELEINVAGIGAISHLLDRVAAMQDDIRQLRNRLSLYE